MNAPRYAAGSDFIRQTCREIIARAARAGVCRESDAWRMTPMELLARIDEMGAFEARRLKLLDTLAWLAGQYVAVALNAPARYPARPNRVRDMARGDDGIRRAMERLAARTRETT